MRYPATKDSCHVHYPTKPAIDTRYRRIHEIRPFINNDSMIYKKMLTISAKCKRIQHCAGFYTFRALLVR